jgi:hypothetical protein
LFLLLLRSPPPPPTPTRFVPLLSPRCVCTNDTGIEWPGPCRHTSCPHPPPTVFYHSPPSPPPNPHLKPLIWPTTIRVGLRRITVGLLETSYDDTYESIIRSRTRTLSKYSMEGTPLPLYPFSHHRSVKKHLDTSLVSSRTSVSRVKTGPRVSPFCPDVSVPSQSLILFIMNQSSESYR